MTRRNLVEEGYTARPIPASLFDVFIVRPDGRAYRVNPVEGTCNCAAGLVGRPCCHVQQAYAIVRETWCGTDDSNATAWRNYELGLWMDEVSAEFRRSERRAAA